MQRAGTAGDQWTATARRAPWELWAYVALSLVQGIVVPLATLPWWIRGEYAIGVALFAVAGACLALAFARWLLRGSAVAWWFAVTGAILVACSAVAADLQDGTAWTLVYGWFPMLLLHFNVRTWVAMSPDERATLPRLPPPLRGASMPTYAPQAPLAQVDATRVDMHGDPGADARATTWFCVFVDHGDVLAWAVRCDLVDGDAAGLARVAEAVNVAYWGDTRQASEDVAARFVTARALEEVVGELPVDGVFALDGASSLRVEAAQCLVSAAPGDR